MTSDATAPDGCVVPLTVSGGGTGRDLLRLEVVLPETPHRLVLDADLITRTFRARWATTPLGGDPLYAPRATRLAPLAPRHSR